MGKPYSEHLRRTVVQAIEDGYTREEIAEAFEVSLSSVGRFVRRWRTTGSMSPEKFGGYKGYALAGREQQIKQQIAECPDITLAELRVWLPRRKVVVGKSSIARFLNHLDLTFKKKPARGLVGPTSPGRVGHGAESRPSLIRDASCSSMKPARRQT
jgi:transposase